MQPRPKRTPRACEQCRQSRRRCDPPYPCRQCVASSLHCEVRIKARPQRQRRQHQGRTPTANDSHYLSHSDSSKTPDAGIELSNAPTASTRSQVDVYELVKGLVHDILQKQHGYDFDCMLVEPHSSIHESKHSSASAPTTSFEQPGLPLNLSHVEYLLEHFNKIMGWPEPRLVDTQELLMTARTYLAILVDLSAEGIATLLRTTRLPMDSTALLFAALALGAVAIGEFNQSRFYFDASLEMVKLFVNHHTLDLCLAYYLQHLLALRFGTSGYAQGIMAQAFLVAHHLGIQRNSHGNPGLRLFLLIYQADQYGSSQHNTEPLIRASSIDVRTFGALAKAEPHMQTLIDLVTINGYVIEQSHQRTLLTDEETRHLEAKIGELCARRICPMQSDNGSFKANYDVIAYIHMMCCRLKLRVPGLTKQSSFIASLSICIHAAEGVLAGYHQLYQPVLDLLCSAESTKQDNIPDELRTPNAASLAVTWRQVRRIMTSVFVIIFAYQHGHLLHDQASRSVALTRLLLEYPRWRWDRKIDELVHALHDIAALMNLAILKHLRALLPNQSHDYLQHLSARQPLQPSESSAANQALSTSQWVSPYWPLVYDFPGDYNGSGFGDSMDGPNAQQFWGGIYDYVDVL